MIQLPHIKARVVRLDELTRRIRKEILTIAAGDDPLLYLERQTYLTAMRTAADGLDEARVALAGVMGRLREGPGV